MKNSTSVIIMRAIFLAVFAFISVFQAYGQEYNYVNGTFDITINAFNPCGSPAPNNGYLEITINSADGGSADLIFLDGPLGNDATGISISVGNTFTFNGSNTLPTGQYDIIIRDANNNFTINTFSNPGAYPPIILTAITSPSLTQDILQDNTVCTDPTTGQIQSSIVGGSQTLAGGGSYTYTWTSDNGLPGLPLTATTDGTSALNLAALLGIPGLRGGTYTLAVQDNYSSCSTSRSFTITDPSPTLFSITPSTPSPLVVCDATDITLNMSGSEAGVNYTIMRNGVSSGISFVGSGASPFLMTFPSAGFTDGQILQVQGINGFCSPANMTGSVILDIVPLPTVVTVSGGGTVCASDPLPDVTFTFTGSLNFNFTYTDGTTNFPIVNHPSNTYTIFDAPAGTYQILSLQDGNGCNATSLGGSVQVIVNALPIPTLTGNINACIGSTETYTTEVGQTNYVWTVQGGTITAGGSATDASVDIQWDGAAPYSVSVSYTDINGCAAAAPTVQAVTVNPLPVPTLTGVISLCFNDTQTYTTEAGQSNYVWTVQGGTITAGGSGTDASVDIQWDGIAPYSVSVNYTDANGCTATAPTSQPITVNPLPVPVLNGSSPVCFNDTQTYTSDAGQTNYVWAVQGGTIVGGGSATDATIDVQWDGVAPYSVSVNYNDANGCAAATPTVLNITINPLPVATLTGNINACIGSTEIYTTEVGQTNYVWTVQGGTITAGGSATDASVDIQWDGIAPYSVSVSYTDINGCAAAAPTVQAVTVNPLPVPTLTGVISLCFNDTQTYTTEAGQSNYVWTVQGGTITAGGSATDASVDIQWDGIAPYSVSVNYTDANGCTATAPTSQPITVNPLPVPVLNGASPVCFNDTQTYTSDAGQTNYAWAVQGGTIVGGGSATDATIDIQWDGVAPYSVSVNYNDANGCAAATSTVLNINVDQLPTAADAGADKSICGTGNLEGNTAVIGTGTWTITNGVGGTITDVNSPTSAFTGIEGITYTLQWTISNASCAASIDEVDITIDISPIATAGNDLTICAADTYILTGASVSGSAATGAWSIFAQPGGGDGVLSNTAQTATPELETFTATVAGTYTLRLTTDDPSGDCVPATDDVVITVNPIAIVDAGSDASACAGGFITLGGSIGGGATSSIWTTSGDGTFTNVLSPTSNYTPGLADISNGSVTLTLTTNDPAGPCIAVSDDVEITIINGIDASLPVNVTISPLCVGGSTTITVDNSETGVSYQLRNDSDDTNVGTPVIGDGGTISLSTGSLSATTTFNILATLSGCPSAELTNTATVTVTGNINAGLSVAAIDNALCSGASTSIQITNAETGVLYQLRNDADDSSVGSALPGNGGTLDLPTGVLTATTTFNILATNGSCSVELTDLETVTVVNAPDATLPVSVTIDPVCSGGASDVEIQNSQPGITYQLRDDNGDVPVGASAVGNGATLSLPTGPLTVTTTFNVLATAGGTCPAVELTTLATVNVTGGLDANLALAPVDDPVCSGTATVIQITGSEVGVTYQLRDDNGNVNIGSPIAGNGGLLDLPTGNLSSSTTFNILATNGTCSIELVNLATVNVEIDPNATIPVSATIDPLCVGGVGGIRIDNSQTGVSYQLRNDADDSNVLTAVAGNGGSIILDTDVLNTTTTFNVLATSGTACSPVELNTTATINVAGTINAGLVTTASPATICAGSSAFVQVEGSESGVSYQLRLDTDDSTIGSPVVSTGGTINLPTGNLTATSQFNVLAGNGTCSIELTDKETITVTPGPNLALNVSANPGLICPGLSSTVIVEGSESGVSYQLRIGNTNVGSPVAGNGGNINLPTGSVTANTTYNVLATQGSCSVQLTSTPTVSLRSAGDPACTGGGGVGCFAYTVLVVDAETMRPSCADQDDGILTMNITGITPGNYIIQLISPTDTLTQVGPSGKYSFINLSPAMYSYKIQDAAGNICQQPYNLPLATVVQATASNPVDAVCFGDASGMVTLDITGGNSPYEYSLDGSSWMPVLAGGTIGNLPSSGTYPILVRDDNTDLCPAEVLVTINSVNPAIQATFDIDPATCDGADGGITITSTTGGGGSGYEYSLNGGTFSSGPFTNLNGGSYTVTVRDNIGCTQDFTVDVTFPGFVAHNVVAENADCDNNGRSGFITLAIADAGVFQVALSTDQFNEPDDMEFNNYNAPSVTYSDLERGTYYVYIKSSGATCATRTAPIVIQGAYAINFDIEPICSGNELSISLTNMTGEPGLPIEIQVYRKFTNVLVDNIQVPAIPATNSYLIDYATHVFLQTPGEYQIQIVQVQSTFCLLSSELIDYDVPLPLFAAIGATTESYPDIENGSMQIINFSGPGPDYMTYIRLDSASVPGQFYEAGPDVVPVNSNNDYEIFYNNIPAGRYEVIVTDKNGCSKELIARVPLDTDIFIPNIFTPNGDGDNDIFFIRNLPENEASIIISNRWGSEVYSSKNYQNNWNAEGVNDGVYYYRLKVPDKEVLTGWIEVLRGAKP